jgi:hypothetical protein
MGETGTDGPHWFAGCGMLVAGGFCYRMLTGDGGSFVSRRMHQLLRVPPTGSSASGVVICFRGLVIENRRDW